METLSTRERGELEREDRGTESSCDQNRESELKGEERGFKEKTDVTEKMEVHLNTLKLLLERGADPNVSRIPVPVLFLAIMAADTEGVRRLLQAGAHTDIPLPPEAGNSFLILLMLRFCFVFTNIHL